MRWFPRARSTCLERERVQESSGGGEEGPRWHQALSPLKVGMWGARAEHLCGHSGLVQEVKIEGVGREAALLEPVVHVGDKEVAAVPLVDSGE